MSKRNQKQTGINATAWFSRQSFVHVPTEPKIAPKQPATIPVDRWIDGRWVSVMVPNPAFIGGAK